MVDLHLDKLPEHMRGGVERYIIHGLPPGDFLRAVLQNDFIGAFAQADDINIGNMRLWAMWLWNYAPRGSYGSPERYNEWVRMKGLNGIEMRNITKEAKEYDNG